MITGDIRRHSRVFSFSAVYFWMAGIEREPNRRSDGVGSMIRKVDVWKRSGRAGSE